MSGKGLDTFQYIGNKVYQYIAGRLFKQHGIRIADHISIMKSVGPRDGQGITFVPKKFDVLKHLVEKSFSHDDRSYICDSIAALATKGEGYREIDVPSLHCALSAQECNIHVDSFGFVAIGPDGKKYYDPDSIQHIVDELAWEEVVKLLDRVHPHVGTVFSKFRPIVPNSRNFYRPAVGGRLVLAKGEKWMLGLDYTKSISGETQKMVTLEVWRQ